jgi:hypothetical protein
LSVLKIEQMGGQLPAWNDHLLPAGQASFCQNAYLFSGALTGWREPKLLRTLTNSAARFVYRVPTTTQATASAILAFLANANANDKVKVGEELYTFKAVVVNEYEVLLGGTATISASNLFKALTLTGTAGVEYGLGTVANPVVSTTATDNTLGSYDFGAGAKPVITLKAPTFGAAFNVTVVTESTSNVRLIWLYDLNLTHTTTTFQGGTNQTFDNEITGAAKWLEFVDPDTNVMRSPVVDDKFGRYYFAGPSVPPTYNTYDRIQADQSAWYLGVPAPGCAMGVNVTGGGNLEQLGLVNSTSSNIDNIGSNYLFLAPITPSGAMTLNSVSFMAESTSATIELFCVLYSDDGGKPSELLNFGTGVVGTTAGSELIDTFTNPTGLLVDVKYWIGFMTNEAVAILKANDTGTTGVKHTATFSNGAPLFAPTMTTGQPDWNMWADLTTESLIEPRAYVYTWITAYDEEGPPSPPTIVNGWSNGVWALTLFTPPPDNMGVTRNITKTRIYRTVPSTTGQTTYFFVADVPVLTETYSDTIDDATVALNTILPSTLWTPPPEGLQGIMSMPNGMAVGFRGNEIWFAEPYRPHAWPSAYTLTTEFPIVGIGVTGQSVVACTSATPYVASGVNPSSMSLTKALSPEPCVSRGSIVSTDQGVYYCSPNGLIKVDQNGTTGNTTELWITRERWRELTPDKFIRAIPLSSSYFAFATVDNTDHTLAQDGFTIELGSDSSSFTIWPQPGGHRIGFNNLSAPRGADIYNVQVDPWTGIGLLIQDNAVYYYDFSDDAPTIQPYTWRSKLYQQTFKKNYEAIKVYFSVPPGSPAQNSKRKVSPFNDPSWAILDADRYGIIRVYADDALVTVREIRSNGELLRIVSGFKADTWQFEIEGRVLISNVQIATSVKELANV